MRRCWIFLLLLNALFLVGCASMGGRSLPACDPHYARCGGVDPQMQDEIADEIGQMLQ